jgi:DNA (cytosine-5)-methyltransferase 1
MASEQQFVSVDTSGLWYRTQSYLANAADDGVEQDRHRIFIVGIRSDLTSAWTPPEQTHSAAAREHSKWISGDYFEGSFSDFC